VIKRAGRALTRLADSNHLKPSKKKMTAKIIHDARFAAKRGVAMKICLS
jgi:hypothetical protein